MVGALVFTTIWLTDKLIIRLLYRQHIGYYDRHWTDWQTVPTIGVADTRFVEHWLCIRGDNCRDSARTSCPSAHSLLAIRRSVDIPHIRHSFRHYSHSSYRGFTTVITLNDVLFPFACDVNHRAADTTGHHHRQASGEGRAIGRRQFIRSYRWHRYVRLGI